MLLLSPLTTGPLSAAQREAATKGEDELLSMVRDIAGPTRDAKLDGDSMADKLVFLRQAPGKPMAVIGIAVAAPGDAAADLAEGTTAVLRVHDRRDTKKGVRRGDFPLSNGSSSLRHFVVSGAPSQNEIWEVALRPDLLVRPIGNKGAPGAWTRWSAK
ncbi:hypothetical protein FHS96_001894 [Sphingomonas zeicaulis]|uniref:hypothetical protein n=1 Tax=Sphingomonas zeicaulis TaxID=1632740 RepID=UPI003D1F7B62